MTLFREVFPGMNALSLYFPGMTGGGGARGPRPRVPHRAAQRPHRRDRNVIAVIGKTKPRSPRKIG
jgi:hypothetical protein